MSCHQNYLLFLNVKCWNYQKLKKNSYEANVKGLLDDSNRDSTEEICQTMTNDNHVRQLLTRAVRHLVIPNFFSMLASTVSYALTSMTDSFDAIRTYCIFTGLFI